MKIIIHDLPQDQFASLGIPEEGVTAVAADGQFAPCKGCFGCWMKTPGICVIGDGLKHIGGVMGLSDEIVIISRGRYGGYSQPVKRVLDRSISVSLPFFTFRGGRLHHRRRYKNKFSLRVILYGDMTDREKTVAEEYVRANGHNMGSADTTLQFAGGYDELGGLLI